MMPTPVQQQLATLLSKQLQQQPHHFEPLQPQTLALPALTRICAALFARAWLAAAAEMKRLVRAKVEEGSAECAGRAELALAWTQLVGVGKDEIPFRLGAAYWQSASQADLASFAVVGVLENEPVEPVEQEEKTAVADGIVVEVVEAGAEIGVVVVEAAVVIAAETVQASVYAAGLEPEVVG